MGRLDRSIERNGIEGVQIAGAEAPRNGRADRRQIRWPREPYDRRGVLVAIGPSWPSKPTGAMPCTRTRSRARLRTWAAQSSKAWAGPLETRRWPPKGRLIVSPGKFKRAWAP